MSSRISCKIVYLIGPVRPAIQTLLERQAAAKRRRHCALSWGFIQQDSAPSPAREGPSPRPWTHGPAAAPVGGLEVGLGYFQLGTGWGRALGGALSKLHRGCGGCDGPRSPGKGGLCGDSGDGKQRKARREQVTQPVPERAAHTVGSLLTGLLLAAG